MNIWLGLQRKRVNVSREIFVDTSAWIAVSDVHDRNHNSARKEYLQLVGDRRTLVTTNLVIAETYIIIRRTGGHAQAMGFLRSLRGSPRLMKVYSDVRLESVAEDILERYTDQGFSYADAVSFAVMQEREIEEAFAFDSHFTIMRFHKLPAEG
jgi:predicted nucleic acid-binding protein